MKYPTIEEVNAADHEQLARWSRFLPSPGQSLNRLARHSPEWEGAFDREREVSCRVQERFYGECGGWNPELSKRIGWRE